MANKTNARTTQPRTKSKAATTARLPREILIPEEYEPIGMWGYFGYEFLFMIPVVGWIICVAFAFMAQNHNLRNFARSQFCWLIIYVVVVCLLAALGVLETVFNAFAN